MVGLRVGLTQQRWGAEAAADAEANEGLASEKEAEAMDEEMRLDVAGRAGLPMVDLEHPRALGWAKIPL